MSNIDYSGRVAIVTGAGTGLGRDYAINLGKRGAKVVVNDLGGSVDGTGAGDAAASIVVEEIKAAGGEAVANFDSVATVEGGANIVKTAIDTFGKVDIVIANAGILRDKSFLKTEEADWDAVMAVHLKGTYNVTRPAFANMKANGYGRIVMTASGSGLFGNFGQANYASAKTGMCGLAHVLNIEGAKYNINSNVIVPSAGTRMTKDVMPKEFFDQLKLEYVTPAVLYLVSEECTDRGVYINAFAGHYSRSQIMTGPGINFKEIPTPEQLQENWDKIMSMDDTKYHADVNTMMMHALSN